MPLLATLFLLAALPWGDTSRLGRPFTKDPSVIRFNGRYLLYYSIPSFGDGRPKDGWAIGIAESKNLRDWTKVGEVVAETDYENKGVAAPFAKVIDGEVHLFYQTYGNGPKDAICHAKSKDGLKFDRNPTNPVFHPTGAWNSGRAIDAEVYRHDGKWYLLAATRDPGMKVQMLTGAVSSGGFDRSEWKQLGDGSLLKPELPWEQDCIEAPSVVVRGKELVMFYAGAYNNAPQQVGVALSRDGVKWSRLSQQPFLPVGKPGSWNSSESGHAGVFVDDDGKTYLFFQGNDDKGKTWKLDFVEVKWKGNRPQLVAR
jgi:sucrose-6-phosphate hydrolase SacC (GH32 family)